MGPLQLFGSIDTAEGTDEAMMCMDIDRPDEAMLHFWEGTTAPAGTAALLCAIKRSAGVVAHSVSHQRERRLIDAHTFRDGN